MAFSSAGFGFEPFEFDQVEEKDVPSKEEDEAAAPSTLIIDEWGFPVGLYAGRETIKDGVMVASCEEQLDSKAVQSSPAREQFHDKTNHTASPAFEGGTELIVKEEIKLTKTREQPDLPSLGTVDDTTTKDGSFPSLGAWADTTTYDWEFASDPQDDEIPKLNRKHPRRWVVIASLSIFSVALLFILLATLGAKGQFQRSSHAVGSVSGGETGAKEPGMPAIGTHTTENDVANSEDDIEEANPPLTVDSTPPTTATLVSTESVVVGENYGEDYGVDMPSISSTGMNVDIVDGTGDDTEEAGAPLAQSTPPISIATPASTTTSILQAPEQVTYVPGLLTVYENGLLLSEGLTSRMIAERRRPVEFANGELSTEPFHRRPDYGATFPMPPDDTENPGGWVYVSNSELKGPPTGQGGVGALYFDKDGNVVNYQMLLTNTTKNCAGGRTPWQTFISCEEVEDVGQIYQVDPFNRRRPERITMGMLGGRYEAFAFDDRNKNTPRFFVSEDLSNGPTLRWTPDPETVNWDEPWDILTGNGTLEYLFLKPDAANNNSTGTFEWIENLTLARDNAKLYARGTEGIDRNGSFLYFVCKTDSLFFILDLDQNTFTRHSATIGLFDGEPDQVKRMVNDTQDILYFGEEASGPSKVAGIHGRNSRGQFFTILEATDWPDEETTGLAFSPNGLHMYVALQDPGVVFDITRIDGYPFHGLSLDVHYHNPPFDHLSRP